MDYRYGHWPIKIYVLKLILNENIMLHRPLILSILFTFTVQQFQLYIVVAASQYLSFSLAFFPSSIENQLDLLNLFSKYVRVRVCSCAYIWYTTI